MRKTNRLIARSVRTRQLIAHLAAQNLPHEFDMLRGILCSVHGMDYDDTKLVEAVFDMDLIAERMDAMNAQAKARWQTEQAQREESSVCKVNGDCLF